MTSTTSPRHGTPPTAGRALAAPTPTPPGGRVQLALDVDDLEAGIAFYSALLGTPPAKVRPGYANFSVAAPPLKLVLIERPGSGGRLNHLGIEVPDSSTVQAEIARLAGAGLLPDEELGTTCCYATQDKAWVTGPGGERWEVYTVLADSEAFGAAAAPAPDDGTEQVRACCGAGDGTAGAGGGARR